MNMRTTFFDFTDTDECTTVKMVIEYDWRGERYSETFTGWAKTHPADKSNDAVGRAIALCRLTQNFMSSMIEHASKPEKEEIFGAIVEGFTKTLLGIAPETFNPIVTKDQLTLLAEEIRAGVE